MFEIQDERVVFRDPHLVECYEVEGNLRDTLLLNEVEGINLRDIQHLSDVPYISHSGNNGNKQPLEEAGSEPKSYAAIITAHGREFMLFYASQREAEKAIRQLHESLHALGLKSMP